MDNEPGLPNCGKVSGYLEMKSRLNLWRRWRKYWFVLDGKMLFYYKTKEKYEKLGHCKGFLDMALVQAVHPTTIARSYPLEIVTRTRTIHLSACDEENRQKWICALLNALHLPQISAPIMERLSSRLSGNFNVASPSVTQSMEENRNSCPVKGYNPEVEMIIPEEDEVLMHCKTALVVRVTQEIKPCKSKEEIGTISTEEEEWIDKQPRSLYEEIVEEVLELTAKGMTPVPNRKMQIANEDVRISTVKIVPPKPPRSTPKGISRPVDDETVEVMPSQDKGNDQSKTDDKAEMAGAVETELSYESANESCYVTAESSEYEGDTSSLAESNDASTPMPAENGDVVEDKEEEEFLMDFRENTCDGVCKFKRIKAKSFPCDKSKDTSKGRKYSH